MAGTRRLGAGSKTLLWAVGLSFGGCLMLGISLGNPISGLFSFAACLGVILVFMACIFAVVGWHEAGHVLAGLAVGMTFHSVEVLGYGWLKTASGMKWYRARPQLVGGFARCYSPNQEGHLRRYRLFILGGPIATVVLIPITYWLMILSEPPERASMGQAVAYLLGSLLFFENLGALAGSLIPFTYSGYQTDCLQLWRLRRARALDQRLLAVTCLRVEIQASVRARDWTRSLVEILSSDRDESLVEWYASYLRYYVLADTQNPTAACAELNKAAELAEKLGDGHQALKDGTKWEQVFAAAWWLKDLSLSNRIRLLEGPVSETSLPTRCRAWAAIALLEGAPSVALEHVAEARAEINRLTRQTGVKTVTDEAWLDDIEAYARGATQGETG